MRKLCLLLLPVVLFVMACGPSKNADKVAMEPPDSPTVDITETDWILIELMGQPIANEPNAAGRRIHIEFKQDGNLFHGYAGCNTFTGTWKMQKPNRLALSRIARTQMACPDMKSEEILFDVLEKADSYYVTDGELTLVRARMAPLARFVAGNVENY